MCVQNLYPQRRQETCQEFIPCPQYLAIASSTPNCTLSNGFTRSLRHLKLLVMLAVEKMKGPELICNKPCSCHPLPEGSASEFAPYLELLPTEADLRGSDLYYAGVVFGHTITCCIFLLTYGTGEDLLRDFGSLPVVSFWRRIQAEHYKEFAT